MNRPREIAFVVLAMLAGVTWWLAKSEDSDTTVVVPTRFAQPGYYLREATLEETDDNGRLYLRVKTAAADQDPATEEIALRTVRVDYFAAAGAPPWVLTSNSGRLPPGARIVTLNDDVTLTGTPVERRAPAVVRTSTMTLDTVTSIATTAAPVRIELGPQVMTATGMRAELNSDRVTLESNVRGRYVR